MAENNTFNFDLDAPATPTLTLDPVEEAAPAEEKKPEPAPAPEEVKLTAEEKAMVDAFAQKIDITNSQQVLQGRGRPGHPPAGRKLLPCPWPAAVPWHARQPASFCRPGYTC